MLDFSQFNVLKTIKRKSDHARVLLQHKTTKELSISKHFEIYENLFNKCKNFFNEMTNCSKLRHQRILEFKGISEKQSIDPATRLTFTSLFFIFENYDYSLKSLLKQKKEEKVFFTFDEMKSLAQELIELLCHLENSKISHLKIKPSSIIMVGGSLKLWKFENSINHPFSSNIIVKPKFSNQYNRLLVSMTDNTPLESYVADGFAAGLVLMECIRLENISDIESKIKEDNFSDIKESYGEGLSLICQSLCREYSNPLSILTNPKIISKFNSNSKNESYEVENEQKPNSKENIIILEPRLKTNDDQIIEREIEREDNAIQFSSKERESDLQIFPSPEINKESSNSNSNFKENNLILSKLKQELLDAENLRKGGNLNEALQAYQNLLEETFDDEEEKGNIYFSIGHIYIELSNYPKAIEYHQKSLDLRKSQSHDSKAVADSYNSLGVSYHGKGDFTEGLLNFEKALIIYQKVNGEKSKETSVCYNNIGGSYSLLNDHNKALEYKLKALGIKLTLNGEENEEVAWSYDNIGIEYSELGQNENALNFKEKALEIRKKILGEDNVQTAISYNNLGVEYGNNGDFQKSLTYHLKALEIRKASFGEAHSETARSYHNIGCCHFGLGYYKKAKDYYNKAFTIRKQVLGENHRDTLRSQRDCEDANSKIPSKP